MIDVPSTAFFRDVWRRRPLHVPGGGKLGESTGI